MSNSERLIMKIAEYQNTCGSRDPEELQPVWSSSILLR
jgi:hypothetical protein